MGRLDKINSELKKEISEIVQYELKDPRLGLITITAVEITPDLHYAKVYFSVLGSVQEEAKAEQGLQSSAGYIRRLIGEKIKMRYTPALSFKLDRSGEHSVRIFKQLEEIKNERKKSPRRSKKVS
ncbi:MAG: 30S ribosome-binding factor RbfA [Candidatus Omnitrophota bacterium]